MKKKLHKNKELLSLFLDNALDKKLEKEVGKHIESCEECRGILSQMRSVREMLGELEQPVIDDSFEISVLNAIEQKPRKYQVFAKRYLAYAAGTVGLFIILILFIKQPFMQTETKLAKGSSAGSAYREVTKYESPLAMAEKKKQDIVAGSKPDTEKIKQVSLKRIPAVLNEGQKDFMSTTQPITGEKLLTQDMKSRINNSWEQVSEEKSLSHAEKNTKIQVSKASVGSMRDKELRKHSYPTETKDEANLDRCLKPAAPPSNIIIRNRKDWEKTWMFQNTVQNLSLPLPNVDFKNQMVVAVLTRENNTRYTIVKTEEKEDRIIVHYTQKDEMTVKKKELPPPPYQIEVVNTKTRVEFQKIK